MTDTLLSALENERRYVARELHDGVAQTALQLGLQAGICRKLAEQGNLDMLANELAQLEERIQLASSQVREMVADMRPPQVEPEAGLDEYIRQTIEVHLERGGPPVEYRFGWSEHPPSLLSQQMLALVRIIQESLANVRKHAGAGTVRLTLSEDDDSFYVTISDNGRGFDLGEVTARPTDKGGAGLANLRARAEAIGGSLQVTTNPDGIGTEVAVVLPK